MFDLFMFDGDCEDRLVVYDTTLPLPVENKCADPSLDVPRLILTDLSAGLLPANFTWTATSGCVLFHWTTNESFLAPGFEISVEPYVS